MSSHGHASLKDWAALIRLPNSFTVIADSTAGFLLAGGSALLWQRHVVAVASVVMLYWSGMVLNDLLDLARDRLERPGRPLASGRISSRSAQAAVALLMTIGIGFAFLAGQLLPEQVRGTPVPGFVAIVIAISIWLYDGPLKLTSAGPVAMGLCRSGSLLLGASVALPPPNGATIFSPLVWSAAAAMGIYISGVTLAGRNEAKAGGDKSRGPWLGFLVTVIGLVMLAFLPRFGIAERPWRIDPALGYPLLVGLLGAQVFHRGLLAVRTPEPAFLQAFIRTSILRIIPFSAAMSALVAGPLAGLSVFALAFPAFYLSRRFHVT